MTDYNKENVYILSVEASDIYSHMVRGRELEKKYIGMMPYSLELNKLVKKGIKIKTDNVSGKIYSDDIINIKFKHKVKSGKDVIKQIIKKIKKVKTKKLAEVIDINEDDSDIEVSKLLTSTKDYIEKLKKYIEELKDQIKPVWSEIKQADLRTLFSENGFYIKCLNKKTGIVKDTKYIIYKRSSSKSRTGQCLAIKENLYNEMIKWSRMNIDFRPDKKIDYASLLAYESLVGSALENEISIPVSKILLVSDLESKFYQECNVIRKFNVKKFKGEFIIRDSISGKFKMKIKKKNAIRRHPAYLDSNSELVEVCNSLFDGESLLQCQYFQDNNSMMLLRNHMFKSAAFSCDIQLFLREHCPEGIKYEEWILYNMLGQPIYAKDVDMICTPTSLKALKFSDELGQYIDMWEHWKQIVNDEGNIFGICKHEKESKRGYDDEGKILQQTSYQMLNCLPMKSEDIKELVRFEKAFINKLKNDDEFFLKYIEDNATDINSHEMFVHLYRRNIDIINTKIFRDFRKSEINKYITHVKKGKIKLKGDYCTILGQPIEFLYHAIGKKVEDDNQIFSSLLKDNEIYTKLFEPGIELVAYRNPTTSPSNVLVCKNKKVDIIDRYFSLSKNIVVVNAKNFAIQDILSSMDYDSDSMVLFNEPKLLELGKKCFNKYKVCINKVDSQKNKYEPTKSNMAIIDNQLATSQRNIGEVVNLGQLCMSTYWDLISQGIAEHELKHLLAKVDVMTILSCISIDLAKKMYNIDIEEQIENVSKSGLLKKEKPMFWKYVSKKNSKNLQKYNCPMDFLAESMSGLDYAEQRDNVEFEDLLVKKDLVNGDRHQETRIIDYVRKMDSKIKSIYKTYDDAKDEEKKERDRYLDSVVKYYNYFVSKSSVNENTMFAILTHLAREQNSEIKRKLLNVLYKTQKDIFLNAFQKSTH